MLLESISNGGKNNNGQMEDGWKGVTHGQPCPICKDTHWCSVKVGNEKSVVCCRRVSEGSTGRKIDKAGCEFFIHEVSPSLDQRHQVYSGLLGTLTLEPRHMADLVRRGLKREEVRKIEYRTLAKNREVSVEKLLKEGLEESFALTPGFVKKGDGWKLTGANGLLIPVRDVQERIVALQVRLDQAESSKYRFLTSKKDGGVSPNTPIHVPLFQGKRDIVRITEGILKADIATAKSGILTIGLPSAGIWRGAHQVVSAIGAKQVRLAYDADFRTKPQVARPLYQLANDLHKRGHEVFFELWEERFGKGIDDLLANDKTPDLVPFDEGITELTKALGTEAIKELDSIIAGGEDGLPTIVVNNKQLRTLRQETWDFIHAQNNPPKLFQRDGRVFRLVYHNEIPQLQMMEDVDVLGFLIEKANWIKKNKDGQEHSMPSSPLLKLMTTQPCPNLPKIQGVVHSPVFGKNGHLIDKEGYHEEDQVWFHPVEGLVIPPVSSNPGADEIQAAKSLLLDELFHDFPFCNDADKAHAVAALLLPFIRRMIDGPTPLHLVEAPTAGSGKSLICKLIGLISTGYVIEACTLPRSQDEMKKLITSELMNGRPVILLDNAVDKVDSASLASVLTAPVWTDRLLGKTLMVTAKNLALWLLTANNPQLSMEIARRCVRIRIDAMEDRPWNRQSFLHPHIEEWVKAERGKLVHAVLTLIQAWIAAGRPIHAKRLGSFENWSGIVGGILQVAKIPGFLGNLNSLYEDADAEGQMWREFVSVWWNKHQARDVRAQHLLELCQQADLMAEVRGPGSEQSQRTKLGRSLKNAKDRVFGGFKIIGKHNKTENSFLYHLETSADKPGGGPNNPDNAEDGEIASDLVGVVGPLSDLGPAQKPSVLCGESGVVGVSGLQGGRRKNIFTSTHFGPKTDFTKDSVAEPGLEARNPDDPSQTQQIMRPNASGLGPIVARQVRRSPIEARQNPGKTEFSPPSGGNGAKNTLDWGEEVTP